MGRTLEIRDHLLTSYPDIYTPAALDALEALAPFNRDRLELMRARIARRRERARAAGGSSSSTRTRSSRAPTITVAGRPRRHVHGQRDPARPAAPVDPGHRPGDQAARAASRAGLRNVAYALLSGADGWMFDGEDALGQVATMSLDNQRNLKLAIARDPVFLKVAEQVAAEMNEWARGFFGRPIIDDWRAAARLHDPDLPRPRAAPRRPPRPPGRRHRVLRLDRRPGALRRQQPRAPASRGRRSIVLYLPKIQTAEEAALWNDMLAALEQHLGAAGRRRSRSTCWSSRSRPRFQLMEIRAALGPHFVGFNTGRWDYINSVSDAMAWDPEFVNPNIDAIVMTYGYMRNYEDRVRRAVNTPDRDGRCALWQGGMEPNIPVGSDAGVAAGMKRAVAGAEREQREGASGKWVAHWKMVHIVRPVWEKAGAGQPARPRASRALTYTPADADGAGPARAGAAHRPRARATCSASRCSTATRSARGSRRRRSSRPTSSATTTSST